MPRFWLLCAGLTMLSFFVQLSAQNNPNTDQGMKPYDSFHGGDLDSVSMTSGNLFFHAGIYSSPQRGKAAFNFALLYNNKGVHLLTTCSPTKTCTYRWEWNGTGVQVEQDQDPRLSLTVASKLVDSGSTDGSGNEVFVNVYSATTFDGSVHQLADTGSGYRSIDASGILWNNSSNTVQDRTGMYSGGAEDPNGNFVSFNTTAWNWTDTLGRVIPWFSGPGATSTASLSSCPQLGALTDPKRRKSRRSGCSLSNPRQGGNGCLCWNNK